MEATPEYKPITQKKHICIGILAHVDAGKTTLAESILYLTGRIRKLGRVDHKDAFLDTNALERARGITIFSKQAIFSLGDTTVTLLDTPGHVDFSAEMERTLPVLDYAILVVSAADGVSGHVRTLWQLLSQYQIPTFLFINKMDQEGADSQTILAELGKQLDERCVDFSEASENSSFFENLAMCDELLLDKYLEQGMLENHDIAEKIQQRKIFPCYFGSALKLTGVGEFLKGLSSYTKSSSFGNAFGAKVYKISRDSQGNRLTHMKITGGILKVKMPLTNQTQNPDPKTGRPTENDDIWEEKVDQIRLYSGVTFQSVDEVPAGTICTVTGLSHTYSGQGLGCEPSSQLPVLEPVMTYRVLLPEGCDVHQAFSKLSQLEEEEPLLHMVWEEQTGEIHARLMGEVQIEILKSTILERFGLSVAFDTGSIVYKETIRRAVEGAGHFEPLRHYAEVHLLMEPGEPGSGLQFASECSEDLLDRNWQRLILTHLEEKKHRGILTGAELTDTKITLISGRAHPKHTEGGDFRQATYRAVRQGLKQAGCVLLEPIYEFRLELPADKIGRAISDIQNRHGQFSPPEILGEKAVLTGTAPVATMQGYQMELISYTKGEGTLACTVKGYEPCHNAEEVIAASGYDEEADLENPSGSIFCSHGAGVFIPWDQVASHMHLEYRKIQTPPLPANSPISAPSPTFRSSFSAEDKELEAIFTRTYGPDRRAERTLPSRLDAAPRFHQKQAQKEPQKEYLLVDGYNIIFSWEELKDLARENIEGARNLLADILCNYQGFKKNTVILVFDAYKVKGNPGEVQNYHNIYIVYTKEAETADQYIEKTVHELGRKYTVTVATSDALEQVIILGQGASRLSAPGLREEIEAARVEIQEICQSRPKAERNYLFHHLPEDTAKQLEEVRLGKRKLGDNH
ncbi:NYN domain-containing protein [Hominifimenecus sp. rT4P-3]|uniref:NYN domain-containing protein n=1 Tax=Hominifimenecus sp. rT4P-3 TaxID=3242979 RepID=UPI003DA3A60E